MTTNIRLAGFVFVLLAALMLGGATGAGTLIDIETGAVFSGYNDVRIPGKGGTLFSISRELHTDPEPFERLRLGYLFNTMHSVSLLAAPLRINGSGVAEKDIKFSSETFPIGSRITAFYRFDSYRISYRWDAWRRKRITAGIGLTAKIRYAAIILHDMSREAVKENTGFVPLINFRLAWKPTGRVLGLLEGDALAAPQGRAEDVFAGAAYRLGKRISLKAGYRILEGGADNDEVYTFSLFHYAALGAVIEL